MSGNLQARATNTWAICCVVAVGSGCGTPSSDDEFCSAELTGEEADSGTEGCMYVPECAEAEDDGPDVKLDIAEHSNPPSPPSGSAPPTGSPPSWSYHSSTDTYYRLASEFELEEHDWPEGTTVFASPNVVDALINGTNSPVTLGIPVAYLTVTGGPFLTLQTLTVQRRRTMSDVVYVSSLEQATGQLIEAFRPEFHLFLPSWVELEDLEDGVPTGTTIFAAVFGDSHGGVSIEGLRDDQTFSILGPSDSIWLESTPPFTVGSPGILVSKPTYMDTELHDVLSHWLELGEEGCGGNCQWETDEGLPPGNCGDQLDNDADCDIDIGEDWACIHRPDFGCDNFDDHNHRWENAKALAMLPDIQWCTQNAMVDGMPWHSDLHSKAMSAATMLNAIKLAVANDPERSVPSGIPTINYRFAYCVFAESMDDAISCSENAGNCPADYMVGGFGDVLDDLDEIQRTNYFTALWDELDVAMHKAEDDGLTPKPVAMVTGIFTGDIRDNNPEKSSEQQAKPVGLAATVGNIDREDNPDALGASTVEADWFIFKTVAHENGHSLGLSHADWETEGIYDGKKGFMYPDTAGGLYSILGPNYSSDAYEQPNQWATWALTFPAKEIPRPNAFDHTGCSQPSQCPDPEYCWNAGPEGICFQEAP
jgi:hypothetical protein